ncbi:hypothetical protein AHAS_Ahas01G0097600 [Arachis hypogaea]
MHPRRPYRHCLSLPPTPPKPHLTSLSFRSKGRHPPNAWLPGYAFPSPCNMTDQQSFNRLLYRTLNQTVDKAANAPIGAKKFATKEAAISMFQNLYCLAQWTLDLSLEDCRSCLDETLTPTIRNEERRKGESEGEGRSRREEGPCCVLPPHHHHRREKDLGKAEESGEEDRAGALGLTATVASLSNRGERERERVFAEGAMGESLSASQNWEGEGTVVHPLAVAGDLVVAANRP